MNCLEEMILHVDKLSFLPIHMGRTLPMTSIYLYSLSSWRTIPYLLHYFSVFLRSHQKMIVVKLSLERNNLRIDRGYPPNTNTNTNRTLTVSQEGITVESVKGYYIVLHRGGVSIYKYSLGEEIDLGDLGTILLTPFKTFDEKGDKIAVHSYEDTLLIAVFKRENRSIRILTYHYLSGEVTHTDHYEAYDGEALPHAMEFNRDGTILYYFSRGGFQVIGTSRTGLGIFTISTVPSEIGQIHRALTYRGTHGEEFIVLVGEDGRVAPYSIDTRTLQAIPGPVTQVERAKIGDIFMVDRVTAKDGVQFEFNDSLREVGVIHGSKTNGSKANLPVEDPYWNCKLSYGRAVAALIILIIAVIFIFLSKALASATRIILLIAVLFLATLVYRGSWNTPYCVGSSYISPQ